MRTLILIALAAHTFPPKQAPDELAPLNACIQHRFEDQTSFGMRRVIPQGFHGVRQFRPENPTEEAVVNDLQNKGFDVALFISGRSVMDSAKPMLPVYRNGVQGPAYITKLNPQELPPSTALLDESRKAFETFQTGDGYNIQKGGWTVAMRPLRANSQACVTCHNNHGAQVKMNDTLGVLMYVYKRTTPRS